MRKGCLILSDPPCPTFQVKGEEIVHRADRTHYDVEISSGYFESRPDYLWTVTGGSLIKGQHTPRIVVEVTGDIGSSITATVEVNGFDRACTNQASTSTPIRP